MSRYHCQRGIATSLGYLPIVCAQDCTTYWLLLELIESAEAYTVKEFKVIFYYPERQDATAIYGVPGFQATRIRSRKTLGSRVKPLRKYEYAPLSKP